MSLKRGFKAEAERIAVELRSELHLAPTDRIDVFSLAAHLAIPVYSLSELTRYTDKPGLDRYFKHVDTDSFSALTIFSGTMRIVIHNESHAATRQAANLAHELSHCILCHRPQVLFSSEGCRDWDEELEAEADYLGGAILLPREAALVFAKRGWDIARIASHCGISISLARKRTNETGVYHHLERLRNWQARKDRA
jgi:Zn-dependent peptidase ImmA (M78 family)